jgi:site-specific recombinase XerC
MLLTDAISTYVDDRAARGEIGARSAAQLGWRLATLARVHPGLNVADLSRGHVLDWQRATGWQRPASRRAYLSTVGVFCAWAVDEGLLDADPTRRLAKIREPRPVSRHLSDGELARLVLVLPDQRARLVVGLMRHGLRCIEVARLTIADYDRCGPAIRVWGKNDHWRRVQVMDYLAVLVEAAALNRPAGPLVGWSAMWVSRQVSAWMYAAGLKTGPRDGRSAHAIRHTAAAHVLAGCGNVNTVKAFLGHANLATTTRYLPDTADDEMRRAMVAGGI